MDGAYNRDKGTLDKDGTPISLAITDGCLGTEHREPKLLLGTTIVAIEVLESSREFIRPQAKTSLILSMDKTQTFGCDIGDDKSSSYRFCRLL